MKLFPMIFAVLLTTAYIPSHVTAADNTCPEIIKFKMGDLYLNFKHLEHIKWSNNECFQCHKEKEWKILNWDKETAHQICIPCHDLKRKGPMDCKECHDPSFTSMKKDY
jgi:hypothetical protein